MKKKQPWFELYPDSDAASRLSIAGGAVKLLSILVLVAAVLYSLTVLWMLLRVGPGGILHHMMDDWDEGFLPLFVLGGLFAACRYAASVLQAKASLLARSNGEKAEGRSTVMWDSVTKH